MAVSYTHLLHEELAPYEDGYVSASDVMFEVKEDGSVTKVEMKDEYSKVAFCHLYDIYTRKSNSYHQYSTIVPFRIFHQ